MRGMGVLPNMWGDLSICVWCRTVADQPMTLGGISRDGVLQARKERRRSRNRLSDGSISKRRSLGFEHSNKLSEEVNDDSSLFCIVL